MATLRLSWPAFRKRCDIVRFATFLLLVGKAVHVKSLAQRHQYSSTESSISTIKHSRREILQSVGTILTGIVAVPSTAAAGEVGARINRAVTESDLGLSVRRSVVQGAQTFDAFDGKFEQFADKYGLGSERSKQRAKPAPKIIPEPNPLDTSLALLVLEAADRAFLAAANLDSATLQKQIEKVTVTVRPSFARSGLTIQEMQSRRPTSASQFNFLSYVQYRAYLELIIDRNINFRKFKTDFEARMGAALLNLCLPNYSAAMSSLDRPSFNSVADKLKYQLYQAEEGIHELKDVLLDKGLVSIIEVSPFKAEQVEDWSEDLADLQWSIALDGEITLQAQILLQEQGYRLYPDFARYAIQTLLQNTIEGQSVEITDYYMDTDYNSDPDKFDPKELLLNIVLEST
jgi:hypothetical protein